MTQQAHRGRGFNVTKDKGRTARPAGVAHRRSTPKHPRDIRDVLDDATLRRGAAEAKAATDFLIAERENLTGKYPHKWVLIDKDGLQKVADSQEELLEYCDANGLWRAVVRTEYLDPDPLPEIL